MVTEHCWIDSDHYKVSNEYNNLKLFWIRLFKYFKWRNGSWTNYKNQDKFFFCFYFEYFLFQKVKDYLACSPEHNRSFLAQFSMTAMFNFYIDEKLLAFYTLKKVETKKSMSDIENEEMEFQDELFSSRYVLILFNQLKFQF